MVILVTEPKTLIARMLVFFVKYKSKTSSVKLITPAGNEYITAEIFPANKLPITVFTISTAKPNFAPSVKTDKRINTFESPNLAPGRIMGGKRFSSIKVRVASAENIPAVTIFLKLKFLIPSPRYRRNVSATVSRYNFKVVRGAVNRAVVPYSGGIYAIFRNRTSAF